MLPNPNDKKDRYAKLSFLGEGQVSSEQTKEAKKTAKLIWAFHLPAAASVCHCL